MANVASDLNKILKPELQSSQKNDRNDHFLWRKMCRKSDFYTISEPEDVLILSTRIVMFEGNKKY